MKVFLSHSSEDRDLANRLAELLEKRHIAAWRSGCLQPGADCKAAIQQAVSEAQGFVFLIGSSSSEDRWQQIEWQAALESDWDREVERPMISVLTGDVAAPAFLADRVVLKIEGALDPLVPRIVHLLLNPDSARVPVNYPRAREEQKQRLDLVKRFALSLKSVNHHPEGSSLPR